MIHNALDQYANGSLSYSEGTNDDVNKFIWSDQDWNPETTVALKFAIAFIMFGVALGLSKENFIANSLLTCIITPSFDCA